MYWQSQVAGTSHKIPGTRTAQKTRTTLALPHVCGNRGAEC